MKNLSIVVYPHPVLTVKAKPVGKIGRDEFDLIKQMIRVMYEEKGVGIAAPQVGVSKRIFVTTPDSERGKEKVYVNPVVLKSSGTQLGPEGCLSLPEVALEVRRFKHVELEYLDEAGKKIREALDDFEARVIQHELDHLDGKLIIDRIEFDQRQKVLSRYQRL
ncbi:MAG: peptide deformylase [Candidatus Omnitrophica bacterium CG11_big_fil_rev_8_21_14_0_20_45_26]|uniref:Peptide deformylase n=1 Tax=Candidatus Abzuiibacterium crystallinum TaxID=1974748 RepID=A0A2H0LUF3_9BACT|nr:MAG: peptide deformylase [Candidatus Omnitrophica bacterium CG11_big_fil_rev_8_21_14_0_20_45_26]PIW65053.1 MAG: peptide deformylase [Candidatus Omnitrophica bacterium CG12_big_fil_rev_8_21_14_0_65_45_16]